MRLVASTVPSTYHTRFAVDTVVRTFYGLGGKLITLILSLILHVVSSILTFLPFATFDDSKVGNISKDFRTGGGD